MNEQTSPAPTTHEGTIASGPPRRSPRKAALAAWLGSTLEYYDFFIYGTAAALVLNRLFFPSGDPIVAVLGAMLTFGIGYLARPLGGLVMSHVGDRIGRKRALMITLVIMGVASVGIGVLPTFEHVGFLATVLLLVARLAQGFSAGAEAAGASTLTLEHAPEGRRGFFTSFVMMGYATGTVLSTLIFIPVALLPDEALLSWGWRVPFWLSAVVLLVAYWVRNKLDETPAFEEARQEGEVAQVPALLVLRTQWQDVLRIVFISVFSVMQTTFTVYALAYATGPQVGLDRTFMLTVNAVTIGLSAAVIPLMGALSDRIGRKPVLIVGGVGCAITSFCYFWALGQGNVFLICLFAFLNMTLFYSCWNGCWTALFPEMFASPVRYTGMALGNQVGLVLTGFAPAIATLLAGPGTYGWIPVAVFTAVCIGVSCAVIATTRETAHVPLDQLGNRAWRLAKR